LLVGQRINGHVWSLVFGAERDIEPVTLKLWQMVAAIAAATFFVGLMAGRYAFPKGKSTAPARSSSGT
jgi:hypothetical protein